MRVDHYFYLGSVRDLSEHLDAEGFDDIRGGVPAETDHAVEMMDLSRCSGFFECWAIHSDGRRFARVFFDRHTSSRAWAVFVLEPGAGESTYSVGPYGSIVFARVRASSSYQARRMGAKIYKVAPSAIAVKRKRAAA